MPDDAAVADDATRSDDVTQTDDPGLPDNPGLPDGPGLIVPASTPPRLVLASASPARLSTLRHAGLRPEVIVSGVDESGLSHLAPPEVARRLAILKAEAVAARLPDAPAGASPLGAEPLGAEPLGAAALPVVTIVIGCDSVLGLDGHVFGKPGTPEVARQRWRSMRGRTGVLHTGHHVIVRRGQQTVTRTEVAATTVHFADLSDAEIDAYVATGEPLEVAGAFTVDGLGGAFVSRLEGDHHNVVGISLPLLRVMLGELHIRWTDLWTGSDPSTD
ncbi:MAG TPA: Maf family protein [Propionibacteriaceae bacterium]